MRVLRVPILTVALLALFAGAAQAKPPTAPPNVAGTSSEPPPAWFDGAARPGWFAYSSFCWTTACVSFIPPARRTDLPRVSARVGETLAIHLGFVPKSVLVRVLETNKSYALVARRDTAWRVRARGLIQVEARAAKGSASYLARITATG